MLVLSLDTATGDLVVGLVDASTSPATTLAAVSTSATRGHNEELLPAIMAVMADAGRELSELAAIVVGRGPGPFTGLRVGMATAAALGQALGIPVYPADTLAALAWEVPEPGGRVLLATDARRREVYWAMSEGRRLVAGPAIARPGELDLPDVTAVYLPAPLRERLPAGLASLPGGALTLPPAALVAVADLTSEPAPLTPAYLRRPDAVPPAPAPLSPAIPEVDLS